MWLDNIHNRAVCGEESRVMFIEGVPLPPCGIVRGHQEGSGNVGNVHPGGKQFSVAKPLQVGMALATENRIVLF